MSPFASRTSSLLYQCLRYITVSWLLQLEKYKAKRLSKDKGENVEHVEHSDDESLHNEKSVLHKESGVKRKKHDNSHVFI